MSPRENVLFIGSLTTAASGDYLPLLTRHQTESNVRSEMLDRLLQNATALEPNHYSKAILVLSETEQDAHLRTLLAAIAPSLLVNATLDVVQPTAAARAILNESDLEVAQEDTSLLTVRKTAAIKRKASPQPPAAVDAPPAQQKVALKLRPRNGAKKASLWTLNQPASTLTIDESTLLTEDDLKRRETIQRPDCDVKRTRKACKDCSCGLRELLLQEQDDLPGGAKPANGAAANGDGKQVVSTGGATSSCGNCFLGDAFRCGSCPYLGLPAFEPGQKVSLGSFGDDI